MKNIIKLLFLMFLVSPLLGIDYEYETYSTTDVTTIRLENVAGEPSFDADTLDSYDSADFFILADSETVTGSTTFSNPVTVNSNITITGTVDGRDVSADGSTLDTLVISSGTFGADIAALKVSTGAIQTELDSLETSVATDTTTLQGLIDALEVSTGTIQSELDSLESSVATDTTTLQGLIDSLELSTATLATSVYNLEQSTASLESRTISLEASTATLATDKLDKTASFGGDVSGTYDVIQVDYLKGIEVASSTWVVGEFLKVNASSITTSPAGTGDVTEAGDNTFTGENYFVGQSTFDAVYFPNGIDTGAITVSSGIGSGTPVADTIYTENVIKGWVVIQGTGTVTAVNSFNVSSITDDGIGLYTIVWDTDFANANYAVVATADGASYGAGNTIAHIVAESQSVGSVQIKVAKSDYSALEDPPRLYVIAIGEQ